MKFILALIISVCASSAEAHDWYNSTQDPVFNSNCCGGRDCAPVDSAWVFPAPGGYRLQMTVKQAQTVNPATSKPVDAVIPWSRVQSPPSAEHEFYACVSLLDRDLPRGGVLCFFASPSM